MARMIRDTSLIVDADNCTGCGECVDACPMGILDLEDDICVLQDAERCLECGTCVLACPEKAIALPEAKGTGTSGREVKLKKLERSDGQIITSPGYTPVLSTLFDLVKENMELSQVLSLEGTDITYLDNFQLEGDDCFFRAYQAEKIAKIGVSSMGFYGAMRADVLVITPGPQYDIPFYIIDWDESEEHIFYICDLLPGDDVGRNNAYLTRYLYEPLEELREEYVDIPGLEQSPLHWVRALHSPYCLTGSVEKSANNVERLFASAVDYFKAWLVLYKNATAHDPDSPHMKMVNARRKNVRAVYKENDPGGKALDKFLGEELTEAALSIVEP